MDTLRINPNSRYDRKIRIGFEGENAVSRVEFDMSLWVEKYGEGNLVLFVLRPKDAVPYPVSLSIVDGTATWNITSTDCARHGSGAIQLKYTVGSVFKKSYIYETSCSDSLDETDTIPDGYDSWLATLTDLAALCESYAVRAENAAERAEAAADGGSEGGGGTLRPATTERLGSIIVGEDLQITPLGVLSVIKANRAEQDNTHPITAAAVFTELGNVNALLQTI